MSHSDPTSEQLRQAMENINAERAALLTEQPAEWQVRYAELGKQLTETARRYQRTIEDEAFHVWLEGGE